jgi:hypothetical protein
MIDVARFVSALLLTVTFAWAGAGKVVRARRWLEALSVYRIPKPLEPLVFVAVPVAEIASAGLILIGATKPAGALSAALLCAFCAALLRARREEGDRLPCGCFGGEKLRDYRLLLARNVALLLPATLLMVTGNTSIRTVPGSIEPLPALLIVVGLMVIGWTGFEVSKALRRGRHS